MIKYSPFSILHSQFAFIFALLLISCADPPFIIHERLEETLQSDLENLVAQIIKGSSKESVLDTPYFVIRDLREFRGDTARRYAAYAEVDFYYFKEDIRIAEKRKFRYDVSRRHWDRYFKELFFY
ncbi:MAG: hypothetical protein LBU89_10095 [Fibromonadaceae bacterium]|jgi:hypothetical protein|nr:hypothetical protein [Fibromonadaceae bacterium]